MRGHPLINRNGADTSPRICSVFLFKSLRQPLCVPLAAEGQHRQHRKNRRKAQRIPQCKGCAEQRHGQDRRRDRLGKAVENALFRSDELHARHIQVEGQQIAEEHHEQNAAHTAQRRRIAERPRVHRERKEHRAHQKRPRLHNIAALPYLLPLKWYKNKD